MQADSLPSQCTWAELREAQRQALSLANTGIAVTIDVGEANDIHPKDKQTFGNRLALSVLNIAYKQEGLFSGPVYQHMTINGSNVMISFNEVGNGLVIADCALCVLLLFHHRPNNDIDRFIYLLCGREPAG